MSAEKPSIPTPAFSLGVAGLIPFIACSLLVWVQLPLEQWLPVEIVQQRGSKELATLALGAYAAVILSFLGGVRWGNLLFDHASLRSWLPLTLSILPSLVAWPSLLLTPVPMFLILGAGLVLQYALDIMAGKRGELPPWYLRLRLILTSGAVLSLLLGLLGNI